MGAACLPEQEGHINDSLMQGGLLELHFSVFPIWTAATLASFTFPYRVSGPILSSSRLSQTFGSARRVDLRS